MKIWVSKLSEDSEATCLLWNMAKGLKLLFLYKVTSQDFDLRYGSYFIILKNNTVKTTMI